uniref:Uncharacterized protein n=1 Tax=Globisporangium ultimum (strain ATCC 200006 / CBS 805.95 / DAOM BR144) TaxID=431595 RepID=K3WVE5_GLOUD
MASKCSSKWVALMLVVFAALAATVEAADECCSTCIGKTSPVVYDYDPLVYTQCSAVKGVCCFTCGSLGDPTYGDTISFASDGTTPTVKAGTWIKMQWTDIKNVTYIALRENQKKTMTPTIGDTAATVTSGYFMICARSVGQVIFRGWGSDPCRQASPEKSITVLAGDAGASCDAAEPDAPVTPSTSSSSSRPSSDTTSAGSGSADTALSECNQNRASIKLVDGVKQCVCVSDWSNPPACDQMPTWKWVVTIGGGVAALLSILISVRAFIKSREKKRLQAEEEDGVPVGPRLGSRKEDVETLQITPDRRSNEAAAPYARENNRALSQPRKPDEREFTL